MLQRAMGGIVNAMALTVETRDPYTAGHQRRVTDLARRIAGEMNLFQNQIEGIHMAGNIHDLGKISIPAEILSKPSRLMDIEFNLIKIHPKVGFDILKTIEFTWPVAQIVLQHHERINGSGYPSGLAANDILIEAKILGVADVVEAMASHRPYRPALGINKALDEIMQKRGLLYDSKIVDSCLKLFNDKKYSFDFSDGKMPLWNSSHS
jgi:HD-GYP domain-containing protein (c-di-GMP phosphodiesterase class II)